MESITSSNNVFQNHLVAKEIYNLKSQKEFEKTVKDVGLPLSQLAKQVAKLKGFSIDIAA